MPEENNTWYVRHGWDPDHARWRVSCFKGPQHPDGATLEGDAAVRAADGVGALLLWTADDDGQGRLRVEVSREVLPKAPDTWYVAIPRPTQRPPVVELVGFASDHLPPGTVVDNPTFMTLAVRSDQQVAAVRWQSDTAVVEEVYVAPAWRRHQLGIKMVRAASAFHQVHGWPGALHSDGRRTDLGQEFTVGLAHPERIARWTQRAAPMDPAEEER